MHKVWILSTVLVAAAAIASSAAARVAAPSGDTCTFTKSGSTYTVHIVTGAGVQQYGFAFGAPGLTVTNVGISGNNGAFTTGSLPSQTSGAWISDTPLTGTFDATLTVAGTATGSLVIVPAAQSQSSYFDAATCKVAAPAPAKELSFSVASKAAYSSAAHAWRLVVRIPVAATVSARQPLATSFTAKPKPLVQAKRVALRSPGSVTLMLKATPQGQARLGSKNALAVKLLVTVDAQDGREAHKTVSLTLRK